MEKREKKIRIVLSSMFVISILLLTVPTLMAMFYHISENMFKTLNTIGLLIVTVRIVISMSLSVGIVALESNKVGPNKKVNRNVITENSTDFKKHLDKEAKVLFIATMVIQFINFMFIHFE